MENVDKVLRFGLQEQSSGNLSQHNSGAYLTPQNSMLPPQGHNLTPASSGLQSMRSGGVAMQTQGNRHLRWEVQHFSRSCIFHAKIRQTLSEHADRTLPT
jgi:hypothetical protein